MILTYHEIWPEPAEYSYSLTCGQFEEHLRFTKETRAPSITFDDGHISHYRHAFPLLEKHGVKAIFFVTPSWTGVRTDAMNWPQLRELADAGHSIQSHSWTHKFLSACSRQELEEELVRSKAALEQGLSRAVNAISAPGGRWNNNVLRCAADAGYQKVYVSDPWIRPCCRHGVELAGRIMVRRTTDRTQLAAWQKAGMQTVSVRKLQYRGKEALRSLVGDRVYHKLWCVLSAEGRKGQPA